MTLLLTIDSELEAFGHPDECDEPVIGSVVSESDTSVMVTNASDESNEIASVATANLSFPEHSHSHTGESGCHDDSSHTLDPSIVSSSLTINDSPIYIAGDSIATDPESGGEINSVTEGVNNSVKEA
jgi:hypothetical protein